MSVVAPIWRDIYYTSTADTLTYYIMNGGTTIFNGRAFKRPDSADLKININRICQNYLSNELPDAFTAVTASTTITNYEAVKDFQLYSSGGTLLETYRFSYDWSYDGSLYGSRINQHYANGMLGMATSKSDDCYENTIWRRSGDYCGDYAIYYLDSYGCWRDFLFEGNCKMFDSYTQYEYNRSFNNNTVEFERGRYISEITTSYELSTGWLSDSEAFNFSRNLVGSNIAYLHNLKTDKISPVIIDESGVEYKENKTNGRHLIEYTIRVKESQNKIRK